MEKVYAGAAAADGGVCGAEMSVNDQNKGASPLALFMDDYCGTGTRGQAPLLYLWMIIAAPEQGGKPPCSIYG
jgi:hypothetical protein